MVSEQDIVDRANYISLMPTIQKIGVINEFYEMANGGSACGIREEYYPDWSDQDFHRVLSLIEKDEG